MAHNMKENGMYKLDIDMVEDIKYGVMEVYTKVTGKMIKQTVVGDLYMQMEISTMANGRMIKLTDSENILLIPIRPTKVG